MKIFKEFKKQTPILAPHNPKIQLFLLKFKTIFTNQAPNCPQNPKYPHQNPERKQNDHPKHQT